MDHLFTRLLGLQTFLSILMIEQDHHKYRIIKTHFIENSKIWHCDLCALVSILLCLLNWYNFSTLKSTDSSHLPSIRGSLIKRFSKLFNQKISILGVLQIITLNCSCIVFRVVDVLIVQTPPSSVISQAGENISLTKFMWDKFKKTYLEWRRWQLSWEESWHPVPSASLHIFPLRSSHTYPWMRPCCQMCSANINISQLVRALHLHHGLKLGLMSDPRNLRIRPSSLGTN